MEQFSAIGGVRLGLVHASWPFARLNASRTKLRLSTVLGTYEFDPEEVVSFEPSGLIRFFSGGVRIVHSRSDYPTKIVFGSFCNPETLIERIRESGFLPSALASSAVRWRGVPLRWSWILIFTLAWNRLMLLDVPTRKNHNAPGLLMLFALFLAVLVSWISLRNPEFQRMILNPGHSVNEIKAYLTLVQAVGGILLVVFSILEATHAFG